MSPGVMRTGMVRRIHGGAAPAYTGYPAEVMADTPISYWRLGEPSGTTAEDEKNVNDGSYVNTPTLGVTGATTDGNTAITLAAASGEYVQCKAGPIVGGLTNWTMEAWINTTTNFSGVGSGHIYCERTASGNDIARMHLNASNVLALTYRDDAGTLDIKNSTSAALNDGNWHHIVITKTGTAIAFYVDGSTAGTGTLSAGNSFTNANVQSRIGDDVSDPGGRWNGSVDEVAVYGSALSGARVSAHHGAA